jgi:hypothetical protein
VIHDGRGHARDLEGHMVHLARGGSPIIR